jgi:dihydroorotase
MIDPHVHLRDFNEAQKETLSHGLTTARLAGFDAVFEMPNTDPPLTTYKNIKHRIELADAAHVSIFHGIIAGLTADEAQVTQIIEVAKNLFPRVVGLKLFAGVSTGSLAVTDMESQKRVMQILVSHNYQGVLSVHCEKVSRFKNELADRNNPFSHTLVRPPESETESIIDMITIAEENGFKGTLHICHISVPESVEEVNIARAHARIKIVCGITPHHTLMWDELMKNKNGYLLRMNPPLRPKKCQEKMLSYLFDGSIDWVETDHAPHTLAEKQTAAGIPVLPFYPHFIQKLKTLGMSEKRLDEITHKNISETFGIKITKSNRQPEYDLDSEYGFDPFSGFK